MIGIVLTHAESRNGSTVEEGGTEVVRCGALRSTLNRKRSHANRRDYGINWTHSVMATFVGDNVEVELEILAKLH